jgi:PAS domain S-box-containing protein
MTHSRLWGLKIAIIGGTILGYILLFPSLVLCLGNAAGALSLLAVLLAAWLLGYRGGGITGVILFPVNMLLYNLHFGFSAWWRKEAIVPHVVGIMVGLVIGYLRDMLWKLKEREQQLAVERKNMQAVIEQRRHVEHALSEAEQRYHQVFLSTTDLIFVVNLKGEFIDINPPAERFIGYERTEILQMNFTNLIFPEYRHWAGWKYLRQYLGNIQNQYAEYPMITKAGETRWIGVTSTLIVEGDQISGFHAVARDMTDRVLREQLSQKNQEQLDGKVRDRTTELTKANRALQIEISERVWIEEALRDSESKYRSLVENIRDVVFQTDAEFQWTFLNYSWTLVTGYSLQECKGKKIIEYIPPQEQDRVQQWLYALQQRNINPILQMEEKPEQQDESLERLDFLLTTAHGQTRWVEMRIHVRMTEGDKFIGTDGVMRDITNLKLADEALHDSKEFLDKILNSLADPVFVKNKNHQWIMVNNEFCRFIGHQEEELLWKSDYDFFSKEQADVFWKRDDHALQCNVEDVSEEFFTNGKGETRTILTQKTVYTDKQGQSFIVGIIRDITEQKLIEGRIKQLNMELETRVLRRTVQLEHANKEMRHEIAERKKAEEQLKIFEHTVKSVNDAISITDLENNILFVNQAFCQMYGYSFEELQHANISRVWTKDEAEILPATLQGGWRGEVINVRKDGTHIPVNLSASVIKEENGRPIALVGVARDISERKRVDLELRKLSQAVEQSPVSVVITDVHGAIEYVNQKFSQVTGYEKDEVVGKNPQFLTSGKMLPEEVEKLWQTILDGGMWSGELQNVRKNGEQFWESIHLTSIKNDHNEVTNVLAIQEDTTDRKKLEAQVRRSQRLEIIGTLASGIAHDLNNVLSPIMMAVQLLRMKMQDQKGLQILSTLESTANRGADIVKQVLSFARGAEGERVLVQPKHLLREVQEIAHETFPRSVKIEANIPKDLWPVLGDATQLHQVFMNLCVNARDAMVQGGTLTVKAENITLDQRQAALHYDAKQGPYVVISILDTGIGIPPEHLDKIFDPFFTTKEIGKGTGLGLSTVLALVKGHAGFISVYSEVGHGTHFKIYLPAAQSDTAQQEVLTPAVPHRGTGETILVVDDEASIRDITTELLESAGYHVIAAQDGKEALQQFEKNAQNIKVVITDMMMPNMDGASLIRQLMKINSSVKVIAASGLMNNENTPEIHLPNVQAFLTKPYTAEKLFWVLDAILYD